MRRIYIILLIFTFMLILNTWVLLHAEPVHTGVLSIDVQDIRMSSSIKGAIEVIGMTKKGMRKFVLPDAISKHMEEYITPEIIDKVCKELISEIRKDNIQFMWVEQLYALMQDNTKQKEAIRVKYLFASLLQHMLPKDVINNPEIIAEAYDIPSSPIAEYPIMPVPAIPEYTSIACDDTLQMDSRIVDVSQTDEKERLALSTAMGTSDEERKVLEELSSMELLAKEEQSDETIHEESDADVMYKSSIDSIIDKRKEKRYKKYREIERLLEGIPRTLSSSSM